MANKKKTKNLSSALSKPVKKTNKLSTVQKNGIANIGQKLSQVGAVAAKAVKNTEKGSWKTTAAELLSEGKTTSSGNKASNQTPGTDKAFTDWATTNQTIMDDYNQYAYGLSQDYLDASERYASMASAAQKEANDFNAEQAQIQRDWSEAMSATAHQREVADLKAAGLNPVISAYGSGSSVGSGAAASASNSLTSAFGQLASQALSAVSSLAQTLSTSATSYANAGLNYTAQQTSNAIYQDAVGVQKYSADVQKYAAELASETNLSMNQATIEMQKYIARINNMTSKDIARIAADANVSAAQVHAAASNYSAQMAYNATVKSTEMNNQTQLKMNKETTSSSLQGYATSWLKRVDNFVTDFITGSGAYGVDAYNKSFG